MFLLSSAEEFADIRPCVENTVSLAAIVEENRQHVADLAEANRQLESPEQSRTTHLEASERRFRAMIESAPEAIVLCDPETFRFEEANEKTSKLFGLTRVQLLGTGFLELSPEWQPNERSSAECAREKMRQAMRGDSTEFEWTHTRADGSRVVCEVRFARLEFFGSLLLRASITEISSRLELEKSLRESTERLDLVLRGAALGTWDWDILHGEFTYNDRFAQMLGRDPREAKDPDNTWARDVHPDDYATASRDLNAHLTGGSESYETEFRLRHKSGHWLWMLVKGSVILRDTSGNPLRMCGTPMDIDERKREIEERLVMERRIQHAQKLESLGDLAGGIAHDFNNILMAILGNADLALQDISPHSPARDNLQAIESAAARAATLSKQMLAYSGKGHFIIEPIAINEFVDEMAHLLEAAIPTSTLLDHHRTDDLPHFNGDASQVRQVIMNLVTNASEALEEKSGVVSVSTGAMECDANYLEATEIAIRSGPKQVLSEGRYVYVEVTDTGCGMDPVTRARIFDPFFSTKFTGRGLGMAAVLGILRGHKGTIKFDSEQGKGTTFRVLFPAVENAE